MGTDTLTGGGMEQPYTGPERRKRPRGRPRLCAESPSQASFYLPPDMHDALSHYAISRGLPVSVVIRQALVFYLQNRQVA